MKTEIFPNIFQIRIPLPHNPLKHINSYLIRAEEGSLLIDTGLNFPESLKVLWEALSEAGVLAGAQLEKILLTHFHVDHVGLIPRIKEVFDDVELLLHPTEVELSKLMLEDSGSYKQDIEDFLMAYGAPLSIAQRLQDFHPAFSAPEAYKELVCAASPIDDGQEIMVGNYRFQALWTPGHSPGHTCLYEPSKRAFFSGDHLLPTITSHVSQFMEDMDPLTDYLNSLKKIKKLNVKVVFPAHEEVFRNYLERITQLEVHHKRRLEEIVIKLEEARLTAYMLASRLQWDISYESWNQFPPFQKYLAFGEALAHLKILERRRLVQKVEVDDIIFYERTR